MNILKYPNPILKFQAKPVKRVDRDLRNCAIKMLEVMHENKGIGLAANQVGLPFRMFVMRAFDQDLCFINPVVKPYGKWETAQEGCLSFPNIHVDIKRRSKCRFKAWDLNGDDIDEEVDGDEARIIQHEVDHLDGTLLIDKQPAASHDRFKQWCAEERSLWLQQPETFDSDTFQSLIDQYC